MLNILHALQSKIFSLSSPHTQPSVEIHVYLPFLCISGSFLSSSGMWFKESIWSLLPLCLHAFLLVTFFTQLPYPSQKWRVNWCVCSSLMCLLKKCNHDYSKANLNIWSLLARSGLKAPLMSKKWAFHRGISNCWHCCLCTWISNVGICLTSCFYFL